MTVKAVPHIGVPPREKKQPFQRGTGIILGRRIKGTCLRRRYEGARDKEVAPVYVGKAKKLETRLKAAFTDAESLGKWGVVVDGVLYGRNLGGWHIWRVSPDEVAELKKRIGGR